MPYTCSCCGQTHDDWPALAFSSPHAYAQLSRENQERIAELNSDFCTIVHPEQTDRIIRCTLMLPIIDQAKRRIAEMISVSRITCT